MGLRVAHALFKLAQALAAHGRVHTHFRSAKAQAEKWDFTMRRIQRIEKLERRIERIFLGVSMALLIFVLLCILIVARRSFGTGQVHSGNLAAQSHG